MTFAQSKRVPPGHNLPVREKKFIRTSGAENLYRIYSIKRRLRINAAAGNKITNKRRISSEECGVYSKIIRKTSVQQRDIGTFKLHNIYKRFTINVVRDFQKSDFEILLSLRKNGDYS